MGSSVPPMISVSGVSAPLHPSVPEESSRLTAGKKPQRQQISTLLKNRNCCCSRSLNHSFLPSLRFDPIASERSEFGLRPHPDLPGQPLWGEHGLAAAHDPARQRGERLQLLSESMKSSTQHFHSMFVQQQRDLILLRFLWLKNVKMFLLLRFFFSFFLDPISAGFFYLHVVLDVIPHIHLYFQHNILTIESTLKTRGRFVLLKCLGRRFPAPPVEKRLSALCSLCWCSISKQHRFAPPTCLTLSRLLSNRR